MATPRKQQESLRKLYAIHAYSARTGDWEPWQQVRDLIEDVYWLVMREQQRGAASPDPETRH
jgi:hypothetical protein